MTNVGSGVIGNVMLCLCLYEYYSNNQDNPDVSWHCLYCTMKFNHQHIPFTLSDNNDIDNVNKSDTMKFCESLPTLEEIYESTKFSQTHGGSKST